MHRLPLRRSCGILLHPTSLAGPRGVGDLGDGALRFIDFLVDAGQSIWQILPLGPTGVANSPYDSRSAFAGNPLLISEQWLVIHGFLDAADVETSDVGAKRADYVYARQRKEPLLRRAYLHACEVQNDDFESRFATYRAKEASWLDDFALYQALHEANRHVPWVDWDPALVRRESDALERARSDLRQEVLFHAFVQFIFDEQWNRVHRYANERGIQIVGDVPIYVSLDSADVWANQEIFLLDSFGKPTLVAGVPPDYFSADGQLWGNPVYRWDALEASGFRWWVERFRRTLELTDLARVDHFRGFQAGWHVPAGEKTAVNGWWLNGPGIRLFEQLSNFLGSLPIIAEDLGIITDDVTRLRDQLGLPGMKVLQFAFGSGPDNKYLPHNFDPNAVVYTGTHDNDTTLGWFARLDDHTRWHVLQYLGSGSDEICWSLIRLAYSSVARTAIIPAQDVLELGSDARMNIPGIAMGNWEWRASRDSFTPKLAAKLASLAEVYGRTPRY
jgi:4-alpha-glucanotransferase